jgi:hypothetical protein
MKSLLLSLIAILVISCSSYKNTYPVDPVCAENIKTFVAENQSSISGNFVDRFSVLRMTATNQNFYNVILVWDSGKNTGKTWRYGVKVNNDCEVTNFLR